MTKDERRAAFRCDSGAAAVEFAVVSLVLIVLFLTAFELGRAFHVLNGMAYAVDFGMRKILLDPLIASGDIESEVRARFHSGDAALLVVQTTSGASERTITATYPLSFWTPLGEAHRNLSVSRTAPR